jgi:hypothetical protein
VSDAWFGTHGAQANDLASAASPPTAAQWTRYSKACDCRPDTVGPTVSSIFVYHSNEIAFGGDMICRRDGFVTSLQLPRYDVPTAFIKTDELSRANCTEFIASHVTIGALDQYTFANQETRIINLVVCLTLAFGNKLLATSFVRFFDVATTQTESCLNLLPI